MLEWFSAEWDAFKKYYILTLPPINNLTDTDMVSATTATIQSIIKNYPGPYYLMVSGGIDSQAMLWYWFNYGVEFIPTHIVYEHNHVCYNTHDSPKYEHLYPELTFKKIKVDPIAFFAAELHDYAHTYYCTSPQLCLHMKYRELIPDGTLIYSGTYNTAFESLDATIMGLHRYQQQTKCNIIPNFFQSTKEIYEVGSNILMKHKKNNPKSGESVNNYLRKVSMMHSEGIPAIPQPTKQSGFEKLKDYYDFNFSGLVTPRDRIKYSTKPSKRVFDILLRYRLTDTIPYSDHLLINYL